jgi:NAD(P)-dependent dehydrogenase (short-subunit alcohol dehydrogenase family)
MQRPGSAENVVDAVLFLVENEFITGETIVVDGGDTLS